MYIRKPTTDTEAGVLTGMSQYYQGMRTIKFYVLVNII